jgi:PAS domain S-box-containing protein
MENKAEDNYLKKELYEKIKTDESIFCFLQEITTDGLWYWDLENPENEWMNPKFWTVLGYDPAKMAHSPSAWREIINQDDLKIANENFIRHCEDQDFPYDQTVRYTHKNGSTVWIRCYGMAICDKNGKPVRMLGVHNDVTNLKNSEEQARQGLELIEQKIADLEQTTKLLDDAQRMANMGVWKLEIATGKTFWTNEVYVIHEVEKSFDHNKVNGIEFYHPNYRSTITQAITDSITKQIPFDVKCKFITAKNNLRWVRSSGYPVVSNGQVTHLIGMFQDITQIEADKEAIDREQQFSSQLLENMFDGFSVIDLDGRQIRVNKAFLRMTGFSEEELIGQMSPYPYWPAEELESIGKAFEKTLAGQEDTFELIFKKKNEQRFPILISVGTLKNEDGKPVNYFANIKDITERKKTELELEATRQKLESIFNDMSDVVWSMTYPALETLFVTPSVEKLFGYSLQQWMEQGNKLWQKVIHPEDLKRIQEIFERIEKEREIEITYRIRTVQAATKWVKSKIRLITDKNGNPIRLDGQVTDITESELAEIALQESRTRYASIVKALPDLIFRISGDGVFLDCHTNDLALLVMPPEAFIGKPLAEVMPESLSKQTLEKIQETLQSNQLVKFEYSYKEAEEIRFWESRMVKSGENEVLLVARDITADTLAQRELEMTKNFLAQTNQVALVGGWEYHVATGSIIWSDTIRHIHEVAPDFVPSFEQMAAFYTPESWELLGKAIQCSLSDGTPYDLELQITTLKGKLLWVRAIGNAEFREGSCVKLYGTFQDIDTIKKNELRIRKHEESLKKAQQIAKMGSWELDIETNEVFWTEELYKMYEFDPSLPPPSFTEHIKLFTPKSWEELSSSIAKTREYGIPYELELKTIRKDKEHGWMWARGEAIFDKNQKIIGLHGTAQDITERKLVKERLKESELRLSIAIEGTEAGIWDWDILKNKVVFSQQWKAMLGYDDAEIENSFDGWKNLWHPEDVSSIEKAVSDHINGLSEKYELIHRCRHKNGEWRWIMTRGKILRNSEGIPYRWIGTNVDITSQKVAEENQRIAKEQAEKANRYKSEFLANMSHEIRTPLNGVIGFTDMLKNTQLSPVQQQYVDNANVSGHTLLGIINDILDFSKIEAGMLELEIVKTDMVELFENSVDIVKFAAGKKDLEILLDIDQKMPRYAHVDPVRLKQILANILGNAVKFTEKGEVELKVRYNELEDDQGLFSIAVRDTGIGISEEQKGKLFKAFSQADSSTTRIFGGTGLGLIISEMIAGKMGSKINISSTPGGGSTFHFDITATVQHGEKFDSTQIGSVKRCLIIDDNANNALILEHMLQQWKIDCKSCDNGIEALKRLKNSRPFDVIICDYNMPYIDGLETIRLIRENLKLSADKQHIILLHSSSSDEGELYRKCNEMGVCYKVSKPVKSNELFTYLCNLHKPKDELPNQDEKQDQTSTRNNITSKYNILIAEDIEINMLLIKTIIKKLVPNAEILGVPNGLQAVEQYKIFKPDLVLMDIQMPVLDGLQATIQIREIETVTGKHIPVIALTAGALKEEREKAFAAGIDLFLTKPLDNTKIKKALEKYLLFRYEDSTTSMHSDEDDDAHFGYEELSTALQDDFQIIREIILTAMKDLPAKIFQLEQAYYELNTINIKSAAHSLKGLSLSMRLKRMANISAKIESTTKENKLENLQTLLLELKSEWDILQKILLKWTQ